jgi:hypothetical protein
MLVFNAVNNSKAKTKSIFWFVVKYNFDTDYCVPTSMDFCTDLISHSQCNEDDNKCICSNGYYREEDTCGRKKYFVEKLIFFDEKSI